MHCVSLADLAATLSQNGPSLLTIRPCVSSSAVLRYWTASRSRYELWHRVMARYRDAKNNGNYRELGNWWIEHRVVLEEILVSELLARVVAAIGAEAAADDAKSDDKHDSLAAVTHGVYLSQIEASNRVAQIILESAGARVEDTVRLNRLRYGVERWTDWLIGRVSVDRDRSFEYSIDAERSKAFCDEIHESAASAHRDTATWLMNSAMREMLVRRTSESCAFPQANHEVATSALALVRPELFDDYGVPKSVWLHRLQNETVLPPHAYVPATR